MKNRERLEARRLRKEKGLSLKTIANKLNVSLSSVSLWVRDIDLTAEQKQALLERNPIYSQKKDGRSKGSHAWKKINLQKRKEYQQEGFRLASSLMHEHKFVGGCYLYWGEGDKNKNTAAISNTDVDLLKNWKNFMVDYFQVDPEKFTFSVQCHVNNGLSVEEIELFWLKNLDLSKKCLRKTLVRHNYGNKYKKNKHKYGIGRLKINNTAMVQRLFGAIRYLAGIREYRWVD